MVYLFFLEFAKAAANESVAPIVLPEKKGGK
jgi:hypothetical protein